MFVTFQESETIPRGAHVHNGNTVTVMERGCANMYRVGRYNSKGKWVTWIAHVEELIGFNPEETV
jgi:hypothetical protein